MKKLFSIVLLLGNALLLQGCALQVPVSNYYMTDYGTPAKYQGATNIGAFRYVPFDQGWLASDQIGQTLIHTRTDIATLMQQATRAELDRSGIKLDNAKITLTGSVQSLESLGDRLKIVVLYRFTDVQTGKTLLERSYFSQYYFTGGNSIFVNLEYSMNRLFYSVYEKFISDPDVQQVMRNQK